MPRPQWLHTMKTHPRRSTPHDHIAMLQQDSLRLIGALKTPKQKYALEPERKRNDRLVQIKFVPVLMQPKLRARLVAIDVARIRSKLRKSRPHSTANRKIRKQARHRRPHPPHSRILGIPPAPKRLSRTAVRHHHRHGQSAWSRRMMKRCGGKNAFHGSEKLGILWQRQAPHQHRAGVNLLICRFCRKLGKEIHRLRKEGSSPASHLTAKGEYKAKLFLTDP
jgi:hypothetical protein